jgi:6-phosphofructokinase 1
LGQRGQEV